MICNISFFYKKNINVTFIFLMRVEWYVTSLFFYKLKISMYQQFLGKIKTSGYIDIFIPI